MFNTPNHKSKWLPFITLLMAFIVSACAAYYSIFGLVLIFAGSSIAVAIMASALEVSKLIVTSVLFNFIRILPWWLSLYISTAILGLMLITSAGVYGFLSSAYQQSQAPLIQIGINLDLAKTEHERKIARLQQMDDIIASISPNYISKRLEEKKQQEPERLELRQRIEELTTFIQNQSSKQLETEVHIGPIIKVAEAFNIERDKAAHYLIILFVFVFDPLAVAMILAFNVIIQHNKKIDLLAQPEPDLQPEPHKPKFEFNSFSLDDQQGSDAVEIITDIPKKDQSNSELENIGTELKYLRQRVDNINLNSPSNSLRQRLVNNIRSKTES